MAIKAGDKVRVKADRIGSYRSTWARRFSGGAIGEVVAIHSPGRAKVDWGTWPDRGQSVLDHDKNDL